MTSEQIASVTPHPDINALLANLVDGASKILGENLLGVYLSGSLAYGDFVPSRSDIDLQAVVRNPLTDNEIKTVETLHKEIDSKHPNWAKRTECSYVPLELLSEMTPPKTPRPWWGLDTMYPEAPAGNEWIINHYFLSKYGIALAGPDFRTLVPPIDVREVQKASARDLFKEWVPKVMDSEWLLNSHYQSYLVLNLCRILHTVIEGEPRSKIVSGRWVKQKYPQWTTLVKEAEEWAYGEEMKKQEEAIMFIRFVVDRVNEVGLLT
jgi:Aminoglycoside adenylyltransferase, C-terminal domain